jgi:hypothetical protein
MDGEYWTRRDRSEATWHRVESEINNEAVTKCGRRLIAINSRGRDLMWTFQKPKTRVCAYCSGGTPSITP